MLYGVKEASKKFNVKPSRIKLWFKASNKEKQTRGRKPIDPFMEMKICEWLKEQLSKGVHLTQKAIRNHAKRLGDAAKFKASKGWLEKFFKRRPEIFEAYTRNRKALSEIGDKIEQVEEEVSIK